MANPLELISYKNSPQYKTDPIKETAQVDPASVSTPINRSSSVKGVLQYDKSIGPEYKAPTVISSQQGADLIEKKKETLANLTSNPLNALPGETYEQYNQRLSNTTGGGIGTGYKIGQEEEKKSKLPAITGENSITYINPNTGQTQKISAESLTPDLVKNLIGQGYSISETSGNLPSWALQNNPELGQAESDLNKARSDLDSLKMDLDKFTVSDSDLKEQISGITSQWDSRIADMNRINERRNKSIETLGTRLGSRYTGGRGGIFGGIISEEERQGVARIAELEGMKQAAITAAKEAARTKNWEVFSKKVSMAESAYEEKLDAVTELNKTVVENNKKIKEREIQSSRDSVVADLMMQGISSPSEILNLLNYDENGKKIGDFTAKEIDDTMKILLPGGRDDIAKTAAKNGAPADVIQSILSASDATAAYAAAGDYIQEGTGIVGEYQYYKRQAESLGQTPVDFNTYQNMDANRKKSIAAAGVASGLDSATLAKVQGIANQFDGEAIVKQYNTIAEQVDFVKNSGVTPTDDIGRIYSFAKVMDPNSAVREGEYATIQSYSTALLQRYGLNANRVFNNEGFLTDEARKFILQTLDNRMSSSERNYKNVASEYARRINKITGRSDGADFITNYSAGYAGDEILNQEAKYEEKITEWASQSEDNINVLNQMKEVAPGATMSELGKLLGIQL